MEFPKTLHLFCHVVDNLGDIGVCWRLARQFAREHGIQVVLWLDDLGSLKKICSALDPLKNRQQILGVTIRRWRDDFGAAEADDAADVVIEAFGCQLPPPYLEAMAKRSVAPIWINLEYLSAEAWVEGCHRLASPHPVLPLTKYFFFPGFTERTGGLLLERGLPAKRAAFQEDPAATSDFLSRLGVSVLPNVCKVSLFCYPDAPVRALFDEFASDADKPVLCLVPEGVATVAVGEFLGQPAKAGVSAERGGLRVQVLPFVDQDDYDKLLWSSDLNFVRGEDSFVRAQWAARPFVWNIYPQEEQAHLIKLDAFINLYETVLPAGHGKIVSGFWHAWNSGGGAGLSERGKWRLFRSILPDLTRIGPSWAYKLSQNGDLASGLIQFIRGLR